jgi:hypothetical protein
LEALTLSALEEALMSKEKSKEESFPRLAIDRANERARYIWNGLVRMLKKEDFYRLREALRSVGLADETYISLEEIFEPNPSDDVLKGLKQFSELKALPNLRGKKPKDLHYEELEEQFDDTLLVGYQLVLSQLKTIPRRYGPIRRHKALQDRILPTLPLENNPVGDNLLRRWGLLPDKRLAEEILAHVYRMNRETIHKYLTRARHRLSTPPEDLESPTLEWLGFVKKT